MKFFEIAPIKIVRDNAEVFTYASPDPLSRGQIVEIPVGARKMVGVVWREVEKPEFETKEILRSLDAALPEHLLATAEWLRDFYATPLPLALSGILPANPFAKTKITPPTATAPTPNPRDFTPAADQKTALAQLGQISKGTVLLHGITGSGKTEIYLHEAKKTLFEKQKSAIILVPEIALTSQLVMNFSRDFENVKVLHSRLTPAARRKIWLEIATNPHPQIIIGARSALFSPVKNLGLIVIDECHEPTFRQDQTPKYSALRVASFLAKNFETKAILGSATPAVDDYFLADLAEKNGGNPIIRLKTLAKTDARPPEITVIDISKKESKSHRFFSKKLLEEIEKTLSEKKQVLIYHNRRGSASVTACHNCGWQKLCENCFLPMTLHHDRHILACHICGKRDKIPMSCPECGEAEIIHKGIGTKMIEEEIRRLFSNYRVARFDADSDKNETVEKLYEEIRNGEIDIIIGTQVIAKGLDLPKLKTVAVVQADAGLALPDFTSSERNFQLLSQVVGRVGRHSADTNVIIQTYRPEAKSIEYGVKQDFDSFYNFEIENRRAQNYPPFVYLLKLTCVYKTERTAVANAQKAAAEIRENYSGRVQIFGPTPAFYERVGDTYRWQIVIKSKKREPLLEIAREFHRRAGWQVDLDSGLI